MTPTPARDSAVYPANAGATGGATDRLTIREPLRTFIVYVFR